MAPQSNAKPLLGVHFASSRGNGRSCHTRVSSACPVRFCSAWKHEIDARSARGSGELHIATRKEWPRLVHAMGDWYAASGVIYLAWDSKVMGPDTAKENEYSPLHARLA